MLSGSRSVAFSGAAYRPTLQELLLHPWLRPICLETASERSIGEERGVKRKMCIEEHEIPANCPSKVSERRGVQSKRGREEDEGQVLMHSEYLRLQHQCQTSRVLSARV
ncbi:hypothetical protein AAFF_G00223820 [Aldrovandia affinis]|uniref:Uncharacterized protein n=1 Tax=Aldrovandia affinis TaxID=143900 RepID=A0AAD7X2Y9_9TELE|nr:hypothetical protein AAFF_G00223820 [Aldrovandia affinis]